MPVTVTACDRCGVAHEPTVTTPSGGQAARCQKHVVHTPPRQCGEPAIRGTDACVRHAGVSTEIQRAKGAASLLAQAFGDGTGEPVDPLDAMLRGVTVAWWRQRLWARLLHDRLNVDDPAAALDDGKTQQLLMLEGAALRTALQASKDAVGLGIADRQVRIAEGLAEQFNGLMREVLGAVFTALGVQVGLDDPRVIEAVQVTLEAGGGDG
jgi:hypothetical protein